MPPTGLVDGLDRVGIVVAGRPWRGSGSQRNNVRDRMLASYHFIHAKCLTNTCHKCQQPQGHVCNTDAPFALPCIPISFGRRHHQFPVHILCSKTFPLKRCEARSIPIQQGPAHRQVDVMKRVVSERPQTGLFSSRHDSRFAFIWIIRANSSPLEAEVRRRREGFRGIADDMEVSEVVSREGRRRRVVA